jgi:hypothetical protein
MKRQVLLLSLVFLTLSFPVQGISPSKVAPPQTVEPEEISSSWQNWPTVAIIISTEVAVGLFPDLKERTPTDLKWESVLDVPGFGTRKVRLDYFQLSLLPGEVVGARPSRGNTYVLAATSNSLVIITITIGPPDDVVLAREAMYSHLPVLFLGRKVNMHTIISDGSGKNIFRWDGRKWSYEQLVEVIGAIAAIQKLPTSEEGVSREGLVEKNKERICPTTYEPFKTEPAYALTRYVAEKNKGVYCDFETMQSYGEEIMTAFLDEAPKIQ